jgi:uncharacterized protein YndB with AHSA1/START domain
VKITDSIHIDRPVDEVFEVLTDPDALPSWQPTTVDVVRGRTGPLAVGERFQEVHASLGMRMTSTFEVAQYEPSTVFELRTIDGPLPLDGRWTLSPNGGGTRLEFVGECEVRGPLRLARRPLARSLTRRFRRYHRLLKDVVEVGSDGTHLAPPLPRSTRRC